MIQAWYSSLNLAATPYNITGYDGYSMPSREIRTVELARTDGSIQVSERFGSKTITISGQIKTNSKAELITAIQQLKGFLARVDGELRVIDEDDVERIWTCTPRNVAIGRQRGDATQATYSVEFYSPKPYSTSQSVELLNTTVTTQPINTGFTVVGTYQAQPLITVTINNISSGTQSITISNQAIGRGITLTQAFNPGDVIRIDTETREVYVNTNLSDYTGTFPHWDIGGGSVSYVDTASTRDVDIVMVYNVRDI